MLRKIISIPEGVYYRGRFRAAVAWSKVMKRADNDDSAVADEKVSRSADAPIGPLIDRAVSAIAELKHPQVRPTGR